MHFKLGHVTQQNKEEGYRNLQKTPYNQLKRPPATPSPKGKIRIGPNTALVVNPGGLRMWSSTPHAQGSRIVGYLKHLERVEVIKRETREPGILYLVKDLLGRIGYVVGHGLKCFFNQCPEPTETTHYVPRKYDFKPFIAGTSKEPEISYNDITQGQIGDCYFAAALSSVAKVNPQLIKNAIIKTNTKGVYYVMLYDVFDSNARSKINGSTTIGKRIQVRVDMRDELDTNEGNIAEITSDDKETKNGRSVSELWPAILERAFAQYLQNKGLHGYKGLHKGGTWEGLALLTGKIPKEYRNKRFYKSGSNSFAKDLKEGLVGQNNKRRMAVVATGEPVKVLDNLLSQNLVVNGINNYIRPLVSNFLSEVLSEEIFFIGIYQG